jgi:5'-3' exonuclease
MLLDTASLYFRAFFGVPDSVTAPDGTPVNAIRGFLDMTSTLVTRFGPRRLVACLDYDWRPAWRVDLVPSYKAHRLVEGTTGTETTPDALEVQVPVLLDVLAALGIATLGESGYEADDVIGTLATGASMPVDVVTGDRDLFQLVDDRAGVRILYIAKGVGNHERVTDEVVVGKYRVLPSQYADFATMRGDASDGLPGVPGIGEKTAASLLLKYGDLHAIVAAAADPGSEMSPGPRRRVLDAADYLEVAPRVVAVARDIDLASYDATLPSAPRDPGLVEALTERWGLGSAPARLTAVLAG